MAECSLRPHRTAELTRNNVSFYCLSEACLDWDSPKRRIDLLVLRPFMTVTICCRTFSKRFAPALLPFMYSIRGAWVEVEKIKVVYEQGLRVAPLCVQMICNDMIV